MKISFAKDNLVGVLGVVASVAPQRSTRPILYNARVEVSADGKVEFTATDLEVALSWSTQSLSADEAGVFLLPAARALSIVREVPGEEVSLVVEGEKIEIQAGKARFRLNTAAAEDFPPAPQMPEKPLSMAASNLTDMIEKTIFAVAKEDFRYAINGLYMCVEGGKFELTGSDGHRLANVVHSLSKKTRTGLEVIAPPKLLQEVIRTVPVLTKAAQPGDEGEAGGKKEKKGGGKGGEEDLEALIAADYGQVFVKIGDVCLSGRQLEGTYPKYKDVIPRERDDKVGVSREALLASLRRVSAVTTEETRSVVFEAEKGTLKLSAADPSVGSAEEEIEVEYKGKKRITAFDPRLLSDGLKQMKETTVSLEIEDDVEAAVIREGEYTYVIMPMRVRR